MSRDLSIATDELAGPATLAGALEESREILEHRLRELARGRLALLGAEERRAVERWARTTFGSMAHVPLTACKRLAQEVPDLFEGAEEETVG